MSEHAATEFWASFHVAIHPELIQPAYTHVYGTVLDSPPWPDSFTTEMTAGDCRLVIRDQLTCEPACPASASCAYGNRCIPNPQRIDIGRLTLSGLVNVNGTTQVEMINAGYFYGALGIAYPPCSPNEPIEISGGGDSPIPAFEIVAHCVEPLLVDEQKAWSFAEGKPATFTWRPPTAPGPARIQVTVDVMDQRPTKAPYVLCDAPDTGSITVDALLVTALLQRGTTGFPSVTLTRVSTGTARIGTLEGTLTVESQHYHVLDIPGLISCFVDDECPDGMSCELAKCVARP